MSSNDKNGIFNIGSEIGLSVEEVLRIFLTNDVYDSLDKKYAQNIINQTLEITNLSNAINIDKDELHENTINELKK